MERPGARPRGDRDRSRSGLGRRRPVLPDLEGDELRPTVRSASSRPASTSTTGRLLEPGLSGVAGHRAGPRRGPHLYRWTALVPAARRRRHRTRTAVTVARGPTRGPVRGCPTNPILTHRSTIHPVQNTGHADLVRTPDGVGRGVPRGAPRGSTPGFHVLGRETFLAGVDWADGGRSSTRTTSSSRRQRPGSTKTSIGRARPALGRAGRRAVSHRRTGPRRGLTDTARGRDQTTYRRPGCCAPGTGSPLVCRGNVDGPAGSCCGWTTGTLRTQPARQDRVAATARIGDLDSPSPATCFRPARHPADRGSRPQVETCHSATGPTTSCCPSRARWPSRARPARRALPVDRSGLRVHRTDARPRRHHGPGAGALGDLPPPTPPDDGQRRPARTPLRRRSTHEHHSPSRRPRTRPSADAITLALAIGAVAFPAGTASAAPPECAAAQPGGPVQVTPDCVDPLYAKPVIDSEQDLTTPVVHHKVSGHFEGTDIRFNIYLPPADQWKGRFFQYTYPTAFTPEEDTSVADDRAIGFSIASGGYAVQAGNAGNSLGYRHTAAAAKFAETVAADYYTMATARSTDTCTGRAVAPTRRPVRPRTPPACGRASCPRSRACRCPAPTRSSSGPWRASFSRTRRSRSRTRFARAEVASPMPGWTRPNGPC